MSSQEIKLENREKLIKMEFNFYLNINIFNLNILKLSYKFLNYFYIY